MKNKNLNDAKKNKNDEFYTEMHDIEKELKYYSTQLKGKTIFCNCDDPEYSNFWIHLSLKFHDYGLKKLITTYYNKNGQSYKLEYDGINKIKTPLIGNGDFRSDESIDILKNSDIVITNPPFSLFREFVSVLFKYDKKFLIIGNEYAVTTKEIFRLFKEEKLWRGYNTGIFKFRVPDEYESTNVVIGEDGIKYASFGNIRWYTNLDVSKRHEPIILYESYTNENYPKYDNYDAIEVDKVCKIPMDYYGIMGVPISYVNKHNPEQFEIIGLPGVDIEISKGRTYLNGKRKAPRIFIKRRDV